MTGEQQQRHAMLAAVLRDAPYRDQYETEPERQDRFYGAEREASELFDIATVGQFRALRRRMKEVANLPPSCANAAKDAAIASWQASTADAWALYLATVADYMRDGDISAATEAAWDALPYFVEAREMA